MFEEGAFQQHGANFPHHFDAVFDHGFIARDLLRKQNHGIDVMMPMHLDMFGPPGHLIQQRGKMGVADAVDRIGFDQLGEFFVQRDEQLLRINVGQGIEKAFAIPQRFLVHAAERLPGECLEDAGAYRQQLLFERMRAKPAQGKLGVQGVQLGEMIQGAEKGADNWL